MLTAWKPFAQTLSKLELAFPDTSGARPVSKAVDFRSKLNTSQSRFCIFSCTKANVAVCRDGMKPIHKTRARALANCRTASPYTTTITNTQNLPCVNLCLLRRQTLVEYFVKYFRSESQEMQLNKLALTNLKIRNNLWNIQLYQARQAAPIDCND
jgi:hypothetical protein